MLSSAVAQGGRMTEANGAWLLARDYDLVTGVKGRA
jgi:hypothetical protein